VPLVHLGVRIPEDLLERIDAASAKLAPAGATLDRTQTVRVLLVKALDALDAETKPKKRG
jgi:multisubunit Na+/H+ antiporter MnhE subunit